MCSRIVVVKLCNAVKENDIGSVRNILLENPEILLRSNVSYLPHGATSPLWEAMLLGHEEIVELLIYLGANVNELFLFERNKFYGLTFLHRLALLNDDWKRGKKIAEILIEHSADVNAYNYLNKKTPLEIAVEHGNCSYIEFLLKNGAKIMKKKNSPKLVEGPEPYVQAFKPMTQVLRAPKINQAEMLQLLINFGFDTEFRHKKTDFSYLQFTLYIAARQLDKIDVVGITKILLDSGVPANDFDSNEVSVLIRAIKLQNIKLVSLLIEGGADVNLKTQDAFPLYQAAFLNNLELIDLLVSSGAEINAKCDQGWTALHTVCYHRNENAIKYLIQKGANISVERKNGKTPFSALEPQKYRESDVPCINIMVKELAKLKFFDDSAVIKKDMKLIQSHLVIQDYFQSCMKELSEMSNTKFYDHYSYYFVLKNSKNVKKLANLTKNEEFVIKFGENIHKFSYYDSDLREIIENAIQARDRSIIIKNRLKTVFGDYLPDLVLSKLFENLKIEDLPLQSTDPIWKCDHRFII